MIGLGGDHGRLASVVNVNFVFSAARRFGLENWITVREFKNLSGKRRSSFEKKMRRRGEVNSRRRSSTEREKERKKGKEMRARTFCLLCWSLNNGENL